MIKLISLELEGFRSFKERSKIDFNQSKTILINGTYSDLSTSSGSGKSSIPIAIAFALGFSDLPATKLKNRESKSLYVKLTLQSDNDIYVIIRNPKLSLYINNKQQQLFSKEAELKIQELLGFNKDVLKFLTYRPQKTFGKILNSTDSEFKDFLGNLLGLTKIENTIDSFNNDIKVLQNTLEQIQNKIDINKKFADSINIDFQEINQTKRDLENINQKIEQITKLDKDIKKISDEISNLDNHLMQINTIKNKVQHLKLSNDNIKKTIVSIQTEIDSLNNNICPVCSQKWKPTAEIIDHKIAEKQELLHTLSENLSFICNSSSLISETNIQAINNNKKKLQKKLISLKTPVDQLIQNRSSLNFKLSTLLSKIKEKEQLTSEILRLENEKNNNLEQLEIKEHSIKLLGREGFLGAIFGEILSEIETETNYLISGMSNINTFLFKLSALSTTKQGKVNNKIEKYVIKNGEKIDIRTLSGGQKTSLELCVDLAVSKIIKNRTGIQYNWIILDEALDGLDFQTKVNAIETIKQQINGMLIVIDHSSEIKEIFDRVLTVNFDGYRSFING